MKKSAVKKIEERRKLYVIIVLIVAIIVLFADLLLFWNSLQEENIGRGFSRYWSQEK